MTPCRFLLVVMPVLSSPVPPSEDPTPTTPVLHYDYYANSSMPDDIPVEEEEPPLRRLTSSSVGDAYGRYFDLKEYIPVLADGGHDERYLPLIFCKTMVHDPITGFCRSSDIDALLTLTARMDADSITASELDRVALHPDSARKLTNPFAGRSEPRIGSVDRTASLLEPSKITSEAMLFEMAEVWAMAILRDAPVTQWDDNEEVPVLLQFLNSLPSGGAPKAGGTQQITVNTLFRGIGVDELVGPLVSQYLVQGFDYGNAPVVQKYKVEGDAEASVSSAGWLDIQNGVPHARIIGSTYARCEGTYRRSTDTLNGAYVWDRVSPDAKRLIFYCAGRWRVTGSQWRESVVSGTSGCGAFIWSAKTSSETEWYDADWSANDGATAGTLHILPHTKYAYSMRVLGSMVHSDPLFQFYYNAALISTGCGIKPVGFEGGAPASVGDWTDGGGPDVFSAVAYVARGALQTAWWNKWNVHMRIRPEVFAQRMMLCQESETLCEQMGLSESFGAIPSAIKQLITDRNVRLSEQGATLVGGISLYLPLLYPEGSPTHPSWPAGHAVVAGACVTVLKAMLQVLNDDHTHKPWPESSCPAMVSDDGESLREVGASGITIVGELNKLASNVATARNMAGVHYRSDGDQGILLGEEYAISFLQGILPSVALKSLHSSFTLSKFDGSIVRIDSTNVSQLVSAAASQVTPSWLLGNRGESCITTCSRVGKSCDNERTKAALSASEIVGAAAASGHTCASPRGATQSWGYRANPAVCTKPNCCGASGACRGTCTYGGNGGSCASSHSYFSRLCYCG